MVGFKNIILFFFFLFVSSSFCPTISFSCLFLDLLIFFTVNIFQIFILSINGNPLQYSCLENPKDGGAWQAAVCGVTKSRTRQNTFTFTFSLSCIGEGNGNPLQCSCLDNPRDDRAWWAAIYGVAQSRTRLKQLSSSSSICIFLSCYPTDCSIHT